MPFDHYAARLKHAQWTWREDVHAWKHARRHIKDRASGRHDKRSAKAQEARERE